MTTGPGQDYIEALLARADESLIAAKTLMEKGLLADTVSRAYYAIYYSAQAIFFLKGISSKTHSGTISLFGKEIVEKGIVPKKLGKIINKAHDQRQKADYLAGIDFELSEVEQLVEDADYFVIAIKKVIAANR